MPQQQLSKLPFGIIILAEMKSGKVYEIGEHALNINDRFWEGFIVIANSAFNLRESIKIKTELWKRQRNW